MPEKPSVPGFDKCNKCCSASDGPFHGPSLATHAEICCLFSLAHPGQYDYDCSKDSTGLTKQKQRGGLPEARRGSPQHGTLDLAVGCETEPPGTGAQSRKRKKIEPRLRSGFKKYTLELRPTKFKKKLWFGTYTVDELSRAQDAVNFYMGCDQKYTHPDSPLIFESKPLKGIKFEDLQPSCDDYILLSDGKRELKYKYFARQVKDVIHSITGKKKKSASSLPKRNKGKGSQSSLPPKPGLCDPIIPSGAGSTTSSGTQEHQLAWDRSPEVDSELSAPYPSFLPTPAEMLTYEEDMQFSDMLLRSDAQRDDIMGYSLEELFSPCAYGESILTDEEDFPPEILWTFPNEELP